MFLVIAIGMFTTFEPSSSASLYAPLQVLQGLGAGFTLQMPLITVQVELHDNPEMLQVANALAMFFTYFGSSTLLSVGLTVFQNSLIDNLRSLKYDTKFIASLLEAGATGGRVLVEKTMPDQLPQVLQAYNDAITNVFVSYLILQSL